LYFFNSKKQGELDFVIENDAEIIPVEVKSGKDYERHNALKNVLDSSAYNIKKAYVFCNSNLSVRGNVIYAPIYMLMFIKRNVMNGSAIYKNDFASLKLK
ncbi:MAG: AAA family ATPase, partial [Bacteroidales bacterium]|nr:AAA family ATPase [Bacteroidales bacterium]